MTNTTTRDHSRPAPPGPREPPPARPDWTAPFRASWALFVVTLDRQVRSRRLIVLALLYVLPIALALLIRHNQAGWRGPMAGYEPEFAEFWLIFTLIPQALVPLTALVYASGMIQDEIEEQTITYLLVRPLPRWAIYLAKLLASLVVTVALTAVFTSLCYLVIGWGQAEFWTTGGRVRWAKTIAIFALSLSAYVSLFGFLSLVMRRALLIGVGYVILLEGVVANIDFVIRKGTVMYYYRVLAERWTSLGKADYYHIDLETAPSLWACVATLLIAAFVLTAIAGLIMESREFRVKTPEGS